MRRAEAEFGPLAREHLANPRNAGRGRPPPAGVVLEGQAGSRSSGSYVRFRLTPLAGRIAAARYEVLGEPALIAAASYLSEVLTDRPARISSVPRGLDLARALGLPRHDHGAALLVEDAARSALGPRKTSAR